MKKIMSALCSQQMNLNVRLVALLVGSAVAYYLFVMRPKPVSNGAGAKVGDLVDMGMYDSYNPKAFGTTNEADRRVTNYGVRREFHHNPMPLGEGCTDCDKYGVPEPAMGHTHVCKCGPPSKRMIDANSGHFMLPHMCAPCTGDQFEPTQLGRWWKRKGCSAPEDVGLDIRPICTRCGN